MILSILTHKFCYRASFHKPRRALECNYSKKIGLPGYGSQQFSITLKTEISDVNQVQTESARLYSLLQSGVDSSIKEVGFLPANESNGQPKAQSNGNGNGSANGHADIWNCSDKQRDLILKIVEEICGVQSTRLVAVSMVKDFPDDARRSL